MNKIKMIYRGGSSAHPDLANMFSIEQLNEIEQRWREKYHKCTKCKWFYKCISNKQLKKHENCNNFILSKKNKRKRKK